MSGHNANRKAARRFQALRQRHAVMRVTTVAVDTGDEQNDAADVEREVGGADDDDGHAYVDHKNLWDWTVRIQVDKHALPSTFSVLIFLGDVPNNSKEWRKAPSFVGSFSAFAHSMARHRGGPQLAQGFVHLNRVLARTPDVHSFDPEDVQPYLRSHLQWRVMCADGTTIDPGTLPSLEVVSIGTPVSLQPGAELPDYGEPTYYYDITEGKPGGARSRVDRRSAL